MGSAQLYTAQNFQLCQIVRGVVQHAVFQPRRPRQGRAERRRAAADHQTSAQGIKTLFTETFKEGRGIRAARQGGDSDQV